MDGDQIRELIRAHGEKQKNVAAVLNLTPDKFSKVLAGRRQLTVAEMDKLRRYFDLKAPEAAGARRLPIVGLVAAGSWREGFEQVMGWMPSPDPALSQDAFVVILQGDSMDLIASEGEAIIVDPADRRLVSGKLYVVRNSAGETTFKRYMENPARLEPCSSSERHRPIFLGDEQIEIIGRAKKKVTDL